MYIYNFQNVDLWLFDSNDGRRMEKVVMEWKKINQQENLANRFKNIIYKTHIKNTFYKFGVHN